MKESNLKIRLYEERGPTSIFIDIEVDADGNLVMSGQDLGKAPSEYWGDSDYEYWIVVKKEQRDLLLLSLIQEMFGGSHDAFSRFREFLIERDIRYDFDSWA
ncbi:MAG: hypothetical protein ACP6KW_11185 [Candidatus Thorarchaeota archaeon]